VKRYWHSVQIAWLTAAFSVQAQGTFIYDQQSSDEGNIGEGRAVIQSSQPIGQSFTPTFSSIGFIRLYLSDGAFDGLGATVFVNLRTDSIIGPVLASTDPVSMPDRFTSSANFFFPTPVPLSPGTRYFFQPVLQAGDATFGVSGHNAFNYAGGTGFFFGQPSQSTDLWFREGIIIPEPGSWSLVLVGLGLLAWGKRRFS
jgi:hypothetical protein